MLIALKKLLFERHGEGGQPARFDGDEKQLAEAALMFHVIAADGIITAEERERFASLLERHFGLAQAETAALMEAARQADNEAIDLYGFTSILKRELDRDERFQLIRNLWEMVYADGVVHELEDNIVWRIADLLGVEGRDRMELKRLVKERIADRESQG